MNSNQTQFAQGIGVMSGTSLDGLDLAHCRFLEDPNENLKWEILQAETVAYPAQWKSRLSRLIESSAAEFARTDVELGRFIGEQVARFIQEHQFSPEFVASHGHTMFHQPEYGFTSQIGDGETMASLLNCPVVTNFRNKDVALGGQGAPLVPCAERALFPEVKLFLNLGGIANLSVGDLAWDVCACNMALNWLTAQSDPAKDYDPGGQLAAKGVVSEQLLDQLESIKWYQTPPPRSLGAERFQDNLLPILQASSLSIEDRLATFSRHIALRIRDALHSNRATGEILITGGGTHNDHLLSELTRELASVGVGLSGGVDRNLIDFKEALCFAYLGKLALKGKPNTIPSVTGAKTAAVSGSIHLPSEGGFRLIRIDS